MRARNWLRSFRKAVRPLLRPARRWVWSPHEIWKRAILHEVAWWDHYLAVKRGEGYVYRTDPDAVLRSPLVIRALERMGKPDVAILDVGAGALTNLGKTYPGYRLRIIAVDPLADHYDELLRKHSVSPPVRTIRCEGERLLKRFDRGTFDIAHANNALDHAYNPVRVIRNMVRVVRPGGYIILRHRRNEGMAAGYRGLHQWDFDVVNGAFTIRHARGEVNVSHALFREATTEAALVGDEVHCLITRR